MAYLEKQHPGGEKQIRSLITQFRNMANSYDDMNFTPPYLSTIKASTLIIDGDKDEFFPIDMPVTLYKSIPHSYLWIVPNFGHGTFANNSLWKDTFTNVTLQFLSGEWK